MDQGTSNPKWRELMIVGAGFHDAGNEPISTVHGSEFYKRNKKKNNNNKINKQV